MVGLWPAVVLALITITLIYATLFQFLKILYHRHFMWFAASIIFLSPFGFVLFQAHNLLELMWILLLTPFYGILALCLSTIWVIRFYCLAFVIFLIVQFLVQIGKDKDKPRRWDSFDSFLAVQLKENVFHVTRVGKFVSKASRKGRILAGNLWKCMGLFLAIILMITLASTFASGITLRNPTYLEAQEFVSTDKTDTHPYVVGTYTCANFASDFRHNAQDAGYECGYVFVYFPDQQSHVLNCFNTTDRGLVFVEPQWDKFVNVTVGKPYFDGNPALDDNYTVLWYYIDMQSSSPMP